HIGVEEPRLGDDARERVPRAAEEAVRRPEVELVFPRALELLAVKRRLPLERRAVAAREPRRERRVGPHGAAPHVLERDLTERRGRLAARALPERREEDP